MEGQRRIVGAWKQRVRILESGTKQDSSDAGNRIKLELKKTTWRRFEEDDLKKT
jgi:hypothetical protein